MVCTNLLVVKKSIPPTDDNGYVSNGNGNGNGNGTPTGKTFEKRFYFWRNKDVAEPTAKSTFYIPKTIKNNLISARFTVRMKWNRLYSIKARLDNIRFNGRTITDKLGKDEVLDVDVTDKVIGGENSVVLDYTLPYIYVGGASAEALVYIDVVYVLHDTKNETADEIESRIHADINEYIDSETNDHDDNDWDNIIDVVKSVGWILGLIILLFIVLKVSSYIPRGKH